MQEIIRHKMQDQYCPECNHRLDGARPINQDVKAMPVEGNLSLCINCGLLLKFNHELVVERIEENNLVEILKEMYFKNQDEFHQLMILQHAIKSRGLIK